jgi:uncharacterized protein YbjT (DUF2867 family)
VNLTAQSPILVTGATGNVGRNVVSLLMAKGVLVRAVTRNPDAASLPDGAEMVRADLSDPSSLTTCLDGVDSAFLMFRALAVPAAPIIRFLGQCVRRIVFLSSSAIQNRLPVQTNPIGKFHLEAEEEIRRTGTEWTFLRPGAFAANALTWWGPQLRAGNILRWPYGRAAYAPIHERDIAEVAVRALTDGGHAGRTYLLTGAQTLTQIEQLHAIGSALGRELQYKEISGDQARAVMSAVLPPYAIDELLRMWARRTEDPAPATRTVEELTGSSARTMREWALDHSHEFGAAGIATPPETRS